MSDTRIAVAPYVIGPSSTLILTPSVVSPPSIDGAGANAIWSSGTSFPITLSTSLTNDVCILYVLVNGTNFSSVTSPTLGTWTARTGVIGSGIREYYAPVSGTLSSEVITIAFTATPSFASAIAFAVNGCDISSMPTSAYDTNAGLPFTGISSTPSGVSTTKQSTLIHYAIRGNGDGAVPAGAGWTAIQGASRGSIFMGVGYQTFTSQQSSISISDTMTGVNGWIADALRTAGQ